MQGKEAFWKWKLPLYVLLAEAAIILLTVLPMIWAGRLNQGLTERLLSGSSADDAVSGWLVLPAMLGDFFMGIFTAVVILLAVLYLVTIAASLGWSILFHFINRKNGWPLCIVAEAPALLVAGGFVLVNIWVCIDAQMIGLLLPAVPMLLLLAEAIAQLRHMWLLKQTA